MNDTKQTDNTSEIEPTIQMSKRKLFLLSLIGAIDIALITYFIVTFYPFEYRKAILIAALITSWSIVAVRAIHGDRPLSLYIMMLAFFCGFVLVISIIESISSGRWTGDIFGILICLAFVPVIATIILLPLYYLRNHIISFKALVSIFALFVVLVVAAGTGVLPFVYKVRAPQADYDIAAAKVSIRPEPVVANAPYSFRYTIKNCGPSTIPGESYDVEFYIDDELASFDRGTSSLHPNRSNTYSGKRSKGLSLGKHSYRLVVDPDNRLKETDETNNILRGSFEVVSIIKNKETP